MLNSRTMVPHHISADDDKSLVPNTQFTKIFDTCVLSDSVGNIVCDVCFYILLFAYHGEL